MTNLRFFAGAFFEDCVVGITNGVKLNLSEVMIIENLKEYFTSAVKDRNYAGISFGAIEADAENIESLGYADVSKSTQLLNDHCFEIGSITKTFTGLLFSKFHLEGKLKLEDQLKLFFPQVENVSFQQIRIVELLTHTSGLPRLPRNMKPENWLNPYADYSRNNLLGNMQSVEVGDKNYAYSNLGFAILGQIIEIVSGKKYEEVLKDEILAPLEMDHTFVSHDDLLMKWMSCGHLEDLSTQDFWKLNLFAAAGEIKSNVSDLLKYSKACLSPDDSPLGEAIKFSIKAHKEFDTFSMGLGWHLSKDGTTISHSGATYGFESSLLISPSLKKAVAVLTNTGIDVANVSHEIFNDAKVAYQEISRADLSLMEAIAGNYQTTIENKLFLDSFYIREGHFYTRAEGQLPLRMHYISGRIFSCLNGEVICSFHENNEQVKIQQSGKEYVLNRMTSL